MGLIQSVFCSMTFCVERVLTWTCCAFVLMLLMFAIILLMVYGISVGYHYAQKELASFALTSRQSTVQPINARRVGDDSRPVVRLVAVNKSEIESPPQPILEAYESNTQSQKIYLDATETPIVVLETERPPQSPQLSQREQDLSRRFIGRQRRSQNITTTLKQFLRPLKNRTQTLLA